MNWKKERLREAIVNGRLYQLKKLLIDFPDINYLDDDGFSPLMRACMIDDNKRRSRIAMVKLLLNHKANVNLPDNHGQNVLNWACKNNKSDIVDLILENCLQDVDFTSQDRKGNTPLIHAVSNNNIHMVNRLVSAMKKFSINVDQRNRQDKTAYLKALEMGFIECANVLSEVGQASQEIEVNPFLQDIADRNLRTHERVRIHSAPVGKECAKIRIESNKEHNKQVKRKNALSCPNLMHGLSPTKPHRDRLLLKCRKIDVPSTAQNNKLKNFNETESTKMHYSRSRKHSTKLTNNSDCHEVVSTSRFFYKRHNNDLALFSENNHLETGKRNNLLRLILNETRNQSTNARKAHPNGASTSSSRPSEVEHISSTIFQARTNSTHGQPSRRKLFSNQNNEPSRNDFPNYYSFLVWKSSLDHPANSLQNLLALQAEQHWEGSSYRKGIAVTKYEQTLEESIMDDRNEGTTSPLSERSSRSEAGRKISAVAKTVRLSLYLANKRKMSNKIHDYNKANQNEAKRT